MLLVLTHDVDWGRRGPPVAHVLERLGRFSLEDRVRFFALRENIYDGVGLIMECEQRQGVRSTFFFRPLYDDGSTVEEYSDVISELRRGGWEVGLHANRGDDLGYLAEEKRAVERVYAEPIVSARVHYLRVRPEIVPALSAVGIRFDSSVTASRHGPSAESSGCLVLGGVVELPITIMDAYMFSYWGVDPSRAYEKLLEVLKALRDEGVEVVTVLWHANSVRMVGGRDYLRLVEELWRLEWLEPVRVRDIEMRLHLCRRGA